ncbi:MAG: protein phosphatase 2C domain-containing protein [Lachnospiraceae bacterium]|nr:protein phosphatase 2C domain-containing protein [Lachnospiraceae bacterium]
MAGKEYRSFGVTHKGAKHEEDVPCQDASAHLTSRDAAIAIVADGHGSSRCFRSDIGSEKAVEIAQNAISAFVSNTPKLPSEMTPQFIDRRETLVSESKIILGGVVREIIDKWFAAVTKDEKEHPLKDDQRLEGIVQKYKDRYLNDEDYRCHVYGTTLMAAVMGENYWFGFQVGDGKCVVLYEDGSWELPIPWDDKCTFNTTTSICDDDSLSRFRYWFGFNNEKGTYTEYGYGVHGEGKDYVREIKSRPLAIFVGSDGVEDSYPRIDNDKYVINFYRNRVVSLVESGYDTFNEEIDGLAKRFADRESTDDVSIAGIIGDFTGKEAMIKAMKHDSEKHEAEIIYSEKRRDADEKKDAYETVRKRTEAVTANQRQLESRIASIEGEITALNAKKASFDSALIKGKSDVEASDCEMSKLQSKLHEFESEKVKSEQEKRTADARVIIADDEAKKAKKVSENAEKDSSKKSNTLRTKKEAYSKLFNELSKTNSSVQPNANQTVSIQVVKTFLGSSPEERIVKLRNEIKRLETELPNLQAQVVATQQNAEAKKREFSTLRQQSVDAQQRTRQVDAEIKRIEQELRTVKIQNRNQRDVVIQLQDEIAATDRNISSKQAEVSKLQAEYETLKEQTKKQTDTLAQIKAAWEKAEAEAVALNATIQNSHCEGDTM